MNRVLPSNSNCNPCVVDLFRRKTDIFQVTAVSLLHGIYMRFKRNFCLISSQGIFLFTIGFFCLTQSFI